MMDAEDGLDTSLVGTPIRSAAKLLAPLHDGREHGFDPRKRLLEVLRVEAEREEILERISPSTLVHTYWPPSVPNGVFIEVCQMAFT